MRTAVSFTALLLLLYGCVPAVPQEEEDNTLTQVVQQEEPIAEKREDIQAILDTLDPRGILSIGDENAKNTLTIFTEYHCKYCMEFGRDYFADVQTEFIETNVLRVQFVPFPLKKYPLSTSISKGLLCALQMDKGIEMHAILTQNQEEKRITAQDYAAELELDAATFEECMQSEEIDSILIRQKEVADQLNIERVPAFILNGEIKIGLPQKADVLGWIREAIEK